MSWAVIGAAVVLLLTLLLLFPWYVVLSLYALFASALLYFAWLEARELDVQQPGETELADVVDLAEECRAVGSAPLERHYGGGEKAA